jgi:hypothetical protein
MPLWYLGATPSEDTSIATVDYVNSLASLSLSAELVKTRIKDRFGLANYASNTWADSVINSTTAGQALARTSDLSAATLSKIPVLGNGVLSRALGPVALDSSGMVNPSLISTASGQTFPKMYWSPSTYPVLSGITTETNITTVTINPSVTSYRVFVTGTINAGTSMDGQFPQVLVRANATGQGTATSGIVVAKGYGMGENYKGGVLTNYFAAGSYTYEIPSWANKIDVVLLGAGGGGIDGGFVVGEGGGPGEFAAVTLVRGGSGSNGLSPGVFNLTGVVGAGGARGDIFSRPYGGSTTCVIPNVALGEARGGQAGTAERSPTDPNVANGASPAPYPFGGYTYTGGAAASTYAPGNPPGGGGGGGKTNNPPGVGAPGAAFFYAYTNDDNPYSQVGIIPVSFDSQNTPLTGSTTLYINLVRSGSSGTVKTTSLNPQISVMVVPA